MILAPDTNDIENNSEQALIGPQAGEVVIGVLSSIDEEGKPRVNFPGCKQESSIVALTSLPLAPQQIGRQVALLFIDGDVRRPIIVGLIHSPLQALLDNYSEASLPQSEVPQGRTNQEEAAYIDGDRILIAGRREVVLKCGEASITLTRAGKILIRGKYILNRSSGVNRIQGCSVQVN